MTIGTPTACKSGQLAVDNGATRTFQPSATVTAGTLAVLGVAVEGYVGGAGPVTLVSVTDTKGNTWTVDNSVPFAIVEWVNVAFASCQVATNLTTSDTITMTFSIVMSNAAPVVFLNTVTGLVPSSAFDKTASGQGTSGAGADFSSPALGTLASANEIIFGLGTASPAGNTLTAGSGFTLANPQSNRSALVYKIVSAATSIPATLHHDNSTNQHSVLAVSYKAPSSTSVKAVDGLVRASVKTVDGLAIASAKTLVGVA